MSDKEREYQLSMDNLYAQLKESVFSKYEFTIGHNEKPGQSINTWKRDLDALADEIREHFDRLTVHNRDDGDHWEIMHRVLADDSQNDRNMLCALWIVLVERPHRPRQSDSEGVGDSFFHRVARYALDHWKQNPRDRRSAREIFGATFKAMALLKNLSIPFGTLRGEV